MPFTPAVQLVYAVDRALQLMLKEGVEQRINRYKRLARLMRSGLKELGLDLILLPEAHQSNILTAIRMPQGMDYWKVHDKLKESGITIYSGKETLAQGIFRVATLGAITDKDVHFFLEKMKEALSETGAMA